ncbi:hypothetical protein [Yersinia intermedia]|uniref:hypothetical protein n=1 Tax=Yersinia intermedia TaxID=631 RepID=UPI0030D407E4
MKNHLIYTTVSIGFLYGGHILDKRCWIDIKSIRDLRFFLWKHKDDVPIKNYLVSESPKNYSYNEIFSMKHELAVLAINEAYQLISNYSESYELRAKELKKMQATQLPLKEFDWFKNCNNACYFVWVYIRVYSNKNAHLTSGVYQENHVVYAGTIYCHLECELFPESHRVRIESIINFFDRCTWNLCDKIELMKRIKIEWHNRNRSLKRLPLRPNEKKKIQWAWEYIGKDKGRVLEGAKKREFSAQIRIINDLGKELSERLTILENLKSELENKYSQEKQYALVRGQDELLALKEKIVKEINKKKMMESIRKTNFHSSSFLSLFMPVSPNEVYLALVCVYNFLYYKDPHFIPRLSKAWESLSYRKSKKKNKNKTLKMMERKLDRYENSSEASGAPEEEIVKIQKDILREKDHEITKNFETRNSDLSVEKDNDSSAQHSGANPWFG